MSYPRLIAQAHHSQSRGEELFDQIVFFAVESCAAKVRQRRGLHQGLAIPRFHKTAFACAPDSFRDHIHRFFEREFLPLARVGGAVFDLLQPSRMSVQFKSICALGTEVPAGNGRLRIAFDGDELARFVKNELSAAHSAVGADRARYFRSAGFRLQLSSALGHRLDACSVASRQDLLNERPAEEEVFLELHVNCLAATLNPAASMFGKGEVLVYTAIGVKSARSEQIGAFSAELPRVSKNRVSKNRVSKNRVSKKMGRLRCLAAAKSARFPSTLGEVVAILVHDLAPCCREIFGKLLLGV